MGFRPLLAASLRLTKPLASRHLLASELGRGSNQLDPPHVSVVTKTLRLECVRSAAVFRLKARSCGRCDVRVLGKCLLIPCFVSILVCARDLGASGDRCRPPAVPLVANDPYFSIWSFSDHLTDDTTRHWTGTEQSMTSMVAIDGKTYRLMGPDPAGVPAMTQSSLEVLPTRTIYIFEDAGVRMKVTFMTPLLPRDLDLLSRPATYIEWEAQSTDGKDHRVAAYFDAAAALAVNTLDEAVVWTKDDGPEWKSAPYTVHVGTQAQPILGKQGDNVRI